MSDKKETIKKGYQPLKEGYQPQKKPSENVTGGHQPSKGQGEPTPPPKKK